MKGRIFTQPNNSGTQAAAPHSAGSEPSLPSTTRTKGGAWEGGEEEGAIWEGELKAPRFCFSCSAVFLAPATLLVSNAAQIKFDFSFFFKKKKQPKWLRLWDPHRPFRGTCGPRTSGHFAGTREQAPSAIRPSFSRMRKKCDFFFFLLGRKMGKNKCGFLCLD